MVLRCFEIGRLAAAHIELKRRNMGDSENDFTRNDVDVSGGSDSTTGNDKRETDIVGGPDEIDSDALGSADELDDDVMGDEDEDDSDTMGGEDERESDGMGDHS
jgi:hypothetical protein